MPRRCGLDHLFTLGLTLGRAAYGLWGLAVSGLPADCPIL